MKENVSQGTITELNWKTAKKFECFVSLHHLLCLFCCFTILTITHSSLFCHCPDGCTYIQWYGHLLSFNVGRLYTFSSFVSGPSPPFKVCNWLEGIALKALESSISSSKESISIVHSTIKPKDKVFKFFNFLALPPAQVCALQQILDRRVTFLFTFSWFSRSLDHDQICSYQ